MPQPDVVTPTSSIHRDALVLPVMELGDHERLFLKGPYFRFLGGVYSRGKGLPEALLLRARECFEPGDQPRDPRPHGELLAPAIAATQRRSGEFVFCGRLFPHIAHFICESLARIWFAKQHPELTMVWTGADGYLDYQQQALAVLGIRNPAIFVQEPTELESLVVPSQGHIMPTFHAPYFLDALGVVEPAPIIPGKKTYLSRVHGHGGGYTNEAALEALLRDAGWDILYPEQLAFAARFDALSSSEVILMIEGAAMTSLLFLRELRSRLFTLCRNDSELHGYDVSFRDYFGAFARDKGWHYWRLDVPKTWIGGKRTTCQFELDLPAFEALMRNTDFLSRSTPQIDSLNRVYPYDRTHDARTAALTRAAVSPECDDVSVCLYRSGIHEQAGALDKAIDEVRAAAAMMPDSVYVHWRLADLLEQHGDPTAARDALLRAIDLGEDGLAQPHVQLARIYNRLGDNHHAITAARKAVECVPAAPGYRLLLGRFLRLDGQLEQARAELALAIAYDPELAPAHLELSLIEAENGDLDAAIAAARAAVRCHRAQPGHHVHLGTLLAKRGDLHEAAKSVETALAIDPDYGWAKSVLANISAASGARAAAC